MAGIVLRARGTAPVKDRTDVVLVLKEHGLMENAH